MLSILSIVVSTISATALATLLAFILRQMHEEYFLEDCFLVADMSYDRKLSMEMIQVPQPAEMYCVHMICRDNIVLILGLVLQHSMMIYSLAKIESW